MISMHTVIHSNDSRRRHLSAHTGYNILGLHQAEPCALVLPLSSLFLCCWNLSIIPVCEYVSYSSLHSSLYSVLISSIYRPTIPKCVSKAQTLLQAPASFYQVYSIPARRYCPHPAMNSEGPAKSSPLTTTS